MGALVDESIKTLEKRMWNIRNGKVNCIPSPYKRFSTDYVGLERGCYYDVTSFTKGGKSLFTSFTFLYYPLLYAYQHPSLELDITYLYFNLEEEKERIMHRFMSYFLHEFTKGEMHFSPRELRSTQQAISEDVLEVLKNDEVKHVLEYFEEHVIFIEESNPTGIMKACVDYALKNGTVITEDYCTTGDFGEPITKKRFKKYIPNNPEKYIVPIIDTINLVDRERGFTQKEAIDKMSEYCAKELRNKYKMSPVVIQQQAFEQEKVDEFKLKNDSIRPSVANLGDSKYPARDANVVIGLFSPARFHLHQYQGYNIDIFEDNIRFVEVLINRDGEMGGMVALYFDGAVCEFKELPKPQIKNERNEWMVNPALEKIQDSLAKKKGMMTNIVSFAYSKKERTCKISLKQRIVKLFQRKFTTSSSQ